MPNKIIPQQQPMPWLRPISPVPQRKMQWIVGLVGNRGIVSGFESFIQRCLDWKARVELDKPGSRIFEVRYNGVALPQAVLHVLYANATIFLERKYNITREVMNTPVQRRRR